MTFRLKPFPATNEDRAQLLEQLSAACNFGTGQRPVKRELATPISHASGLNARGMLVTYPSVFAIQVAVARHFGIETLDLQRRGSGGARPRQLAYWLCRRCTLMSLPEIGRAFGGRDHTTVMHGIRRIDELLRTDPDIACVAISLRYQLTPRERVA